MIHKHHHFQGSVSVFPTAEKIFQCICFSDPPGLVWGNIATVTKYEQEIQNNLMQNIRLWFDVILLLADTLLNPQCDVRFVNYI